MTPEERLVECRNNHETDLASAGEIGPWPQSKADRAWLLAEVDRLTADHEWTLGVCDWLTEQYIAAQAAAEARIAELETEQAALDAALDEVDRADPERGVAWGIDSENCRAWERAVARHRGRQS